MDHDRQLEMRGCVFNGGDEVEIIVEKFDRRHENVDFAFAPLYAKSRARHPG